MTGSSDSTDLQGSPESTDSADSRERQGAALIGRRIGIALFWCLAVFVIGASARSVITELYGTAPAGGDQLQCAASLRALHGSLLEQASAELRSSRDAERLTHWLSDWDRRFASTSEPCASLADTRRTLLSLRERVEAMLHDYAHDERPLTERIERALQRYVPRSTPPRKT
jgi:hypothetical protein